ncbi:MAG: hypothetical protein ACI36V_03095 [Coriobacteriales bacterium]
MDDLYRSTVWMLAERDGLAPLEAWEKTNKTLAFRQLLDSSTGFYLKTSEEIYEIFRGELGL